MGNDLMTGDEMNPKGFFVDLEFERLMNECFDSLDYPGIGDELPTVIRDRVEKLITDRESGGADWGIKQSFAVALIPSLRRICGSVKLIRTVRDSRSSRLSLAKHTDHSYETIRRLGEWCRAAGDWAEAMVPTRRVDFDSLIDSPSDSINQIGQFLGREPNLILVGFVDPTLRNF